MVEIDFEKASSGLRSVVCTMGTYHVERDVVSVLFSWAMRKDCPRDEMQRLMVLKGKAGSGKTVVLHDLQERLVLERVAVLGLKSDLLFVEGKSNIDEAAGFPVLEALRKKAEETNVVLLVDQVDALSITLSKNRVPIMSINAFLQDALKIQNVCVVVACRTYDFEYDPVFHWMRGGMIQDCDELSPKEVEDIFHKNGIDSAVIDAETKNFLRTPLYLSIYCRLSTHKSHIVSMTRLYESWINQVIIDDVPKDITNTKTLSECLDFVATRMIQEQELTVPCRALKADCLPSCRYLVDKNVLLKDEDDLYIQFPHQTLLDYIYARFFFENEHTLEQDFRDAHQGLFVRPRLKYVLDYLHETDPKQYIQCLTQITEEKSGVEYTYHYHLRHLAVSSLASYEHLTQYDKRFIIDHIYTNEELYSIYESFVYGRDNLLLLNDYIERLGGLKQCREKWLDRLISMLRHLCGNKGATEDVVQTVMRLDIAVLDEKNKEDLVCLVNYMFSSEKQLEQIRPFVEQMDTIPIEMGKYAEYYKRLLPQNPQRVRERLERYFKAYLKSGELDEGLHADVPNGVQLVVKELKEQCPFEYLAFGRFVLLLYTEDTLDKDVEIKTARKFITFNRHNGHCSFADKLLSGIMDTVEQQAEARADGIERYLQGLADTDSAACHIVAMVGWIQDIETYHRAGYTYLRDNLNRLHHSSALDYYQKELFKVVFPILTDEEQNDVMTEVAKIDPKWEHTRLPYNAPSRRHPIALIGYTRGQYYNMVPEAIIRQKRFANAYKELQELKRKYIVLENAEPNRMMVYEGWSTMPVKAYEYMSDADILTSMERIHENKHIDWNEPTLTGHSRKLSSMASEEPERFLGIYMTALDKERIPLTYITEGFPTIYAHVDETQSEKLLSKLILRVGTDVNQQEVGLMISVIRLADVYIKKKKAVPKCLFAYTKLVATQYDETADVAYDKEHNQPIDVNTAINRVGGAAMMHLIESIYHTPYAEPVFKVFECIADKASEVTKCAMLYKLALFINYDCERTRSLFLRLTKNYEESLLCLPAHQLNPLFYITKDGFDQLLPYFEHCVACSKAHPVAVNFLFRSWLDGKNEACDMCLGMGDATEAAAVQLVKLARAYYSDVNKEICNKVLYRYLDSDSTNMGFAYDSALGTPHRKRDIFDMSFVDKYFHSNVCAFATDNAYELLRMLSEEDPRKCLDWLCGLYDKMKQYKDESYKINEVVDILLRAYRRIVQFKADDVLLDRAIDLLDDILLTGRWGAPLNEQLNKSEE